MNSAAVLEVADEMADAITGMAIPMPVQLRARVEVILVKMPFQRQIWLLERTLRWLGRHGVEVLGYGGSTFSGMVVNCDPGAAGRLNSLLAEERVSRGHRMTGAGRVERWEARDPATQVLICWTERMTEGGR
jgi:hypothetical protein